MNLGPTLISPLGREGDNQIYIKREDLLPYSFGGNKARKGALFFREIDRGHHGYVVTYGSGSSNHCRIVANMAAARGMGCRIISPDSAAGTTFNGILMDLFGAEILRCPVEQVHDTIEAHLAQLRREGADPYFIPGGGHGNLGTQAYVDCFQEIRDYERETGISFDYLFHASGTGTTQAGLICGKLLAQAPEKIVGISIARKNPYGREVVLSSVREYLGSRGVDPGEAAIQAATVFDDAYVRGGYGAGSREVTETLVRMMVRHGIPMDSTYVGKAYAGMMAYLAREGIRDRNILFLHTGGTPLFFNDLANL